MFKKNTTNMCSCDVPIFKTIFSYFKNSLKNICTLKFIIIISNKINSKI